MKLPKDMNLKLCLAAILALLEAGAGAVTITANATVNALIPDGDLSSGVASTITLAHSGIASITDVSVSLDVAGSPAAWNSDYYAYLTHGSSLAILLNRVGMVNAADPNDFGYGDNGFNVTFAAGAYNIHDYQNTAYALNGAGQLAGTWGPDGRNVGPLSVTDATLPTALLSSFNGLAADGGWTLFILDAAPGGVGALENWGLTVDGSGVVSVPESSSGFAGLLGGVVAALAVIRQVSLRKLT